MSWAERLKATFSGEIAAGDVTAMLAATTPLDALREQLADRRLSARIAHLGEEWRVSLDSASLATPLWLGESLVTLAQSLCAAEAEQHPDRPGMLSPACHDLAIAALQPVETIIGEASAAAADPTRPTWITSVVLAGPRGEVAALPLPMAIPLSYAQGLYLAAERLHGTAAQLLADLTALLHQSPAPSWLTTAVQREKGDLAAGSARLAMLRIRLDARLPDPHLPQAGDHALAPICVDLWSVLNTAFTVGQRLSDPRLLPGWQAAATAPNRPVATAPATPAQPSRSGPNSAVPTPSAPAHRPTVAAASSRDLPTIATPPVPALQGRHPPDDRGRPASERPASTPRALPEIGRPASVPAPPSDGAVQPLPEISGQQTGEQQTAHELPRIGPE